MPTSVWHEQAESFLTNFGASLIEFDRSSATNTEDRLLSQSSEVETTTAKCSKPTIVAVVIQCGQNIVPDQSVGCHPKTRYRVPAKVINLNAHHGKKGCARREERSLSTSTQRWSFVFLGLYSSYSTCRRNFGVIPIVKLSSLVAVDRPQFVFFVAYAAGYCVLIISIIIKQIMPINHLPSRHYWGVASWPWPTQSREFDQYNFRNVYSLHVYIFTSRHSEFQTSSGD